MTRFGLVATGVLLVGTAVQAQTIQHPVIIGYSNQVPTHPLGNPAWLYVCGTVGNQHPDQFSPDGKKRSLIHSVSPMGDLTHEGGARWILDVRLTGPYPNVVFNALIARPETVGSEANPTWYYVPAQDDPVDHVLLDAASGYTVEYARWSTKVESSTLKVAFTGTGPVAGQPKRGLFVGRVSWGASGPVGTLQDITLVAEAGEDVCGGIGLRFSWGTANQLAFASPALDGGTDLWLADVTGIPVVPPTLLHSGVSVPPSPSALFAPALSRSGLYLAYVAPTADGNAIHVRALANGATHTLPTGNLLGGTIRSPEWSPDDQYIVFNARPRSADYSTYKSRSDGSTNQPAKLTSPKVSGGVLVGAMHVGLLWRL